MEKDKLKEILQELSDDISYEDIPFVNRYVVRIKNIIENL